MKVPGGEIPHPRLRLGTRRYDLGRRALVMGVLTSKPFLREAEAQVAAGADILDLGTGPVGSHGEELDRVASSVEALSARFDVAISVNTGDARVLDAGLTAGAVLAHDPTGFADPDYLTTARKAGASVVASHTQPHAGDDLIGAVRLYLEERLDWARTTGFAADEIVVDAGLDLGKTQAQSALLLRESDRFAALGYPLLLSASDQQFLGREASLVAAAYGVAHGCRILRVDDVAGTVRVARTVERILEARTEKEDHPK